MQTLALQAAVEAAGKALAARFPNLETNAVLRLGPVEARFLKDMLDKLIGPALGETMIEAEAEQDKRRAFESMVLCSQIVDKLDNAVKEVCERLELAQKGIYNEPEERKAA